MMRDQVVNSNAGAVSSQGEEIEALMLRLQQISLILDPDGDGLKYTVTRSLNSDDCGALARLLDCVNTGNHLLKYEDESVPSDEVDSYKMPKFD